MRIVAKAGNDLTATAYIVEFDKGRFCEMVESLQPPLPREKKWVLIVSTLFGCPVRCLMCDAGGDYQGWLTKEEMFDQIDYMVVERFPDRIIPAEKFKIQFARMGEPAFNHSVLEVLEELPSRYNVPGLIPSLSTIAPVGTDHFFEKLLELKRRKYDKGRFQFQISIHTTDEKLRDKLMPVRKWDFVKISQYGRDFFEDGDKKITLNFALTHLMPLDARILRKYFDPDIFLVKMTPLNPTYRATQNGLVSHDELLREEFYKAVVGNLQAEGYDVIVSIGEIEENYIGSNCGQYLRRHLESEGQIDGGYSYEIQEIF